MSKLGLSQLYTDRSPLELSVYRWVYLVKATLIWFMVVKVETILPMEITATCQDEISLQADLEAIRTWSTINKIPLNAAKCAVMPITRSHRPNFVSYLMGDAPLETISTHKHLRVVLSSNPMETRSQQG